MELVSIRECSTRNGRNESSRRCCLMLLMLLLRRRERDGQIEVIISWKRERKGEESFLGPLLHRRDGPLQGLQGLPGENAGCGCWPCWSVSLQNCLHALSPCWRHLDSSACLEQAATQLSTNFSRPSSQLIQPTPRWCCDGSKFIVDRQLGFAVYATLSTLSERKGKLSDRAKN